MALWTPALISQDFSWYVSDDEENTVASGHLTTIKDKGNGGYDLLPWDDNDNYKAELGETLNSRPVWVVDESSSTAKGFMRTHSSQTYSADNNVAGLSFFAVARSSGATSEGLMWLDTGDAYVTRRFLYLGSSGQVIMAGRRASGDGYSDIVSAGGAVTSGWHILNAEFANGSGMAYMRVDGADGSPVINGSWLSAGPQMNVDAACLCIGFNNNGGSPGWSWDGAFAEVLVVEGVVDATLRQKIVGYLAWQWGMEGDLDASHPYKSAAPTDDEEPPDPEPSITVRPLVLDSGYIKELPTGSILAGVPTYLRAYAQAGTMLKLGLTASYGLTVTKADGVATLNVAVALNG